MRKALLAVLVILPFTACFEGKTPQSKASQGLEQALAAMPTPDPNSFVATTKTAPDYTNEKAGWKLVQNQPGRASATVAKKDGAWGVVLNFAIQTRVYTNKKDHLAVQVMEWKYSDGKTEPFGMVFTDDLGLEARYAIRSAGNWFVAKAMDTDAARNDLGIKDAVLDKDHKPVSLRVTLDTLEGPKEIMLVFR